MDKKLYRFVQWPWMAGIIVFLAVAQVPLGPWYFSAWFVIGAALLALVLARAAKLSLTGASPLPQTVTYHP